MNWSFVGLFTNDGVSLANGVNLNNGTALHAVDATDAVVRLLKMKTVSLRKNDMHCIVKGRLVCSDISAAGRCHNQAEWKGFSIHRRSDLGAQTVLSMPMSDHVSTRIMCHAQNSIALSETIKDVLTFGIPEFDAATR